jgi:hypothetical protein
VRTTTTTTTTITIITSEHPRTAETMAAAAAQTLTTAGMSAFLRDKASSVEATPVADIPNVRLALNCVLTCGQIVAKQRAFFATGATHPLSFRKEQMRRLYYLVDDNQDAFLEALTADLAKPPQEAIVAELGLTLQDIVNVVKNVCIVARNVRSP